ncbi:hypothetical protein ACOSQ4_024473 [Xanthoceras sorbifolium]
MVERQRSSMLMNVVILPLCLVVLCTAIESPQYAVVHSESDFEVRLYRDSAWMSARVRELSFEKATLLGFHSLIEKCVTVTWKPIFDSAIWNFCPNN